MGYEQQLTMASKQFESALENAGYFTYEGDGWNGAIKIDQVTAINWQPCGLEKFTVVFYHKDAPIQVTLGMGNFYKLIGCINQV